MIRIARFLTRVFLCLLGGFGSSAFASTLTNLYSFHGPDGAKPVAGLVLGTDGNLYGTTADGGVKTNGTIFRISPAGVFTNLYTFSGPDGADPEAALVLGVDSNFYGTTYSGGTNNLGTVFSITPAGALTNLYAFSGPDGANPLAALVQGTDGNFYGTTFSGGLNGFGSVFSITPTGALTNLYSFSGPDGAHPTAPLVLGLDGNFYGTTSYGGANNYYGTLFSIAPTGEFLNLFSFAGYNGGGADGAVIIGVSSNFYGIAGGGANGVGTVFQFSLSGGFTNLYSFSIVDGANPHAALVMGSDGILYGTTENGGLHNTGTVFGITTDGILTNLTLFTGKATGINPRSTLVQANNGLYYGTTRNGGTNLQGNVFTFSPCEFSLDVTNVIISPAGGTDLVTVVPTDTNCGWTAVSKVSWITIKSASSPCAGLTCPDIAGLVCGCGSGDVAYAVAPNPNSGARIGTMMIAGQTVTVAQCSFSLSATSTIVSAAGGLKTVAVRTGRGCGWTAVSNDPFIQVTKNISGTGRGRVGLFISPNPDTFAKTGTVSIAGLTFTVLQQAAPCQLTLLSNTATFTTSGAPPAGATFPAAGGSSNVVVDANGATCAWTVTNKESFVTITSATSFTGDGTVTYNVATNASTKARSDTVTIAGRPYKINQLGAP